MAVPPSSDVTPGLSTDPTHDPHGGTAVRLRRVLLVVLTVLALVAGGLVLWFLAQGRADGDPRQAPRDEVMSQSRQFMLRMGTFGPEQLDDQGRLKEYRTLVSEVITPKFKASFDEQATVADQMVAQVGVSRSADVFSTGVSALDDDSATALVAGSFTDTFEVKGEQRPQEPVPFRYELKLEKIEGRWLVDDFTPVTGGDGAGQSGQSGQPGQPGDPGQSGQSGQSSPGATP